MADGTSGARSATPSELLARAARIGQIRVIVQFELENYAPEGVLNQSAALAQRRGITLAQNRLSSVLETATNVTQFETVPMLSAFVDAADLERLMSMPGVIAVFEDVPMAPQLNESVPLIRGQFARNRGATGAGYSVAVLDTGTSLDHEAFTDAIVAGACFGTNSDTITSLCPGQLEERRNINSGRDCHPSIFGCGHGTHVAGIAMGDRQNRQGVAAQADLVSIKVFSRVDSAVECGDGPTPCLRAYLTDLIKALEQVNRWRNTHNIAAVNMSMGSGLYGPCVSPLSPIIETLRSRKIATVVSSGNGSWIGAVSHPACIPASIAVGSTRKDDTVSPFSNHSRQVSFLAPGSFISAPRHHPRRTDLIETMSGTSMAAPHVAGAFAALRTRFPETSVDDIERALACSGTVVEDYGWPLPRIDMEGAFRALNNPNNHGLWGFWTQADVDEWNPVINTWTHAGNRMRTNFEDGSIAVNMSPFCAQDARVDVRMQRNPTNRATGIFLSSYVTGNYMTGLLFGFETGETGNFAYIDAYNALRLEPLGVDMDELCLGFPVELNEGGVNDLRVIARDGEFQFLINGTEVCSATDPSFRIGSVGVMGVTQDPPSPADRLDVFRVEATALSGTHTSGAAALSLSRGSIEDAKVPVAPYTQFDRSAAGMGGFIRGDLTAFTPIRQRAAAP